jgi:glutathione S-transferase
MIALHYDAPTPDAVKLIVTLRAAGLDYEAVPVDTAAYAQWEAPHNALAPQGQVPVLVENGLAMPEAAFALQYIGEAHAPALAPADPWLWYQIQALNQQIDGAIGPAVNLLGWTRETSIEERAAHRARLAAIPHRQKPAGWHAVWADAEANEDQLANARERIEGGLDQIEARLGQGEWLVGGAFTLADINAFALVRAAREVLPQAVAARPAVAAWLGRIEARAGAGRGGLRAAGVKG